MRWTRNALQRSATCDTVTNMEETARCWSAVLQGHGVETPHDTDDALMSMSNAKKTL